MHFVCLAKRIPHLFLLLTDTFLLCRLSEYDVVVTTYSLLSKEVPTSKEEGEVPAEDYDVRVRSHIVDRLMFCSEVLQTIIVSRSTLCYSEQQVE